MSSESPRENKKKSKVIFELNTLGIEELRDRYKCNLEASDIIDTKASSFLAGIGIVLALFGFTFPEEFLTNNIILVSIFFVIIFLLLCLQVILTIRILTPQGFRTPFLETYDGISSAILDKASTIDAQKQLIVDYLASIEINRKITLKKCRLLNHVVLVFSFELLLSVGLRFLVFFM